MPAGASVLTVEFKVNLLAPAAGERFLARGSVIKPGRTLTVVEAEVAAVSGDRRVTVAQMLATMMCLTNMADAPPGK
jgi:acyl-coenzyme A thioesterase PaaI-like protein